MRRKQSMEDYLSVLSLKYEVYPNDLYNALVAANTNKKAECGNLSIERRGKSETHAMFLIKRKTEVVGQFPVQLEFLSKSNLQVLEFKVFEDARKRASEIPEKADSYAVREVRAGMSHVNLKARVLELSPSRRVTTRYGNYATLAKALIGDETGKIKLCLWNEQINSIAPGDAISIKEARASKFKGETQLSIGTKGTLSKDCSEPMLIPLELPVAKINAH